MKSFRSVFVLVSSVPFALLGACAAAPGGPSEESSDDASSEVASAASTGCSRRSMFVVGTPRNFGVAPGSALPMECKDGVWESVETFAGYGEVFHAGAFKFVETGNFSTGASWGDFGPRDGVADLGGDGNDIVVDMPGRYRIRFDDRSSRYDLQRLPSRCRRGNVVARGVSSRDGTRTFDCIGDGVYGSIVMFSHARMTISIDGRDRGTFDEGRYLIEYRESDGSITSRPVSPACGKPFAYARGTFNGWGLTEMECENGHYALTIGEPGRSTEFKFDTAGDFSESYGAFPHVPPRGDGHFDSVRNVFGYDIGIFGRRHVHFYDDGSFAFDRHD
ncbi:MAG: hypothetical protein U0169_01630 [Polyangiaceae bacterium]